LTDKYSAEKISSKNGLRNENYSRGDYEGKIRLSFPSDFSQVAP